MLVSFSESAASLRVSACSQASLVPHPDKGRDEPSWVGGPLTSNQNTHAHSAEAVAAGVSKERARSNEALRGSRMIHLPLLCSSRRGASGGHFRRILTMRGRVSLAHLILRDCCADGGARAGVLRPARMGLID